MKKLRFKMRTIEIIENTHFLLALILCFWVDWRLGVALILYESNVCLMILRKTDWRKYERRN